MSSGLRTIRFVLLLLGAIAGLACSGLPEALRGTPEPAAPPALPMPPVPPPAAPLPPPAAPPNAAPAAPLARGHVVSHAEAVAAFEADCHHRFAAPETAEFDAVGDDLEECAFFEFDQNCSPDPSGCWDRGQECVKGCSPVCTGCQTTCANTCDDCKSACQGNPTCLHTCAESRASCRETCVEAKATCAQTTCPAVESTCSAAFEKERAEKCPECDGLKACVLAGWESGGDPRTDCPTKFPKNAPECVEWCSPDM